MRIMKFIIVVGFLVAFFAGGVAGIQWRRTAPPAAPREGDWLSNELNLSPVQTDQIKKIWTEGLRATMKEQEDRRRTLRKERDDAIAALIPAEQKAAYDSIVEQYSTRSNQLNEERSKAFEAAIESTRQLLNPEQRQKYEEILKKREAEGRGRGHARRAETRPASQPSN